MSQCAVCMGSSTPLVWGLCVALCRGAPWVIVRVLQEADTKADSEPSETGQGACPRRIRGEGAATGGVFRLRYSLDTCERRQARREVGWEKPQITYSTTLRKSCPA